MLYYPQNVWEFRGFCYEVNRLCLALRRIESACNSLSETLSNYPGCEELSNADLAHEAIEQ